MAVPSPRAVRVNAYVTAVLGFLFGGMEAECENVPLEQPVGVVGKPLSWTEDVTLHVAARFSFAVNVIVPPRKERT